MAITIDGTGSITGLTAGGLPDGSITTDDLAANAVTYAKIGTTEQGQLCKAWVNFNGTSTVAIRASYNVSSITDNGTGDYTVNFTTAMPDANYSLVATSSGQSGVRSWHTPSLDTATTPTASLARVSVLNISSAREDDPYVFVAIFR